MLTFTIRRSLIAIPTLLFISLIIFLILDLAPSDPTASLPMTISPEVRAEIRASLGLDEPVHIRFLLWLNQFFIAEPINLIEQWTGWTIGDGDRARVVSWQTRSPVVDLIAQRMPQTLWVVGTSYIVGILIAVPIGVISAYRQYSIFDQLGTFISMLGFSVPTFFTGVLFIVIFSVQLGWFPSVYDTTHSVDWGGIGDSIRLLFAGAETVVVDDEELTITAGQRLSEFWGSFIIQMKQIIMPVMVLGLYNASQISRFMRASMLDNLNQDYVRTARAKGMSERIVVLVHVLRNSMIPVITVLALGVPQVFGGAIITEQVFKVNGLGHLLIGAIQSGDIPTVQTLTFIFAFLIVIFNLVADVLYGILDPRIRYD